MKIKVEGGKSVGGGGAALAVFFPLTPLNLYIGCFCC